MRIGLESCAYFGLYDYEEGFKKLKTHGYSSIDYAELCKRHSDLYKWSEDQYRGFLTDIGECADKYDVEAKEGEPRIRQRVGETFDDLLSIRAKIKEVGAKV